MAERDAAGAAPGPSLAELRPRLTTLQWVTRFVLVVGIVSVLIWAWKGSEIAPGQLWQKRDNAYEFLVGRQLDPAEVQRAEDLAERQVRIIAEQEARQAIRAARAAEGLPPLPATEMRQRIAELAVERLATMDPARRASIYADELERTLGAQRGGFFPPNLNPADLQDYSEKLLETVAIAIWGTLFAVLLAVPAAMLAAQRSLQILIPGDSRGARALRWSVQAAVRRVFDLCRGFNEYVMALIFVAVIGLGPFPGVLALAVHTFGVLGKVISEAIETIDNGPLEGVAATGASGAQTIAYAVMPQVTPYIVSQTLLRFESNVRSATILGVVGAGGIGFLLQDKINGFKQQEVCTIMIMIIIVVSVIDLLCGRIMRRFI